MHRVQYFLKFDFQRKTADDKHFYTDVKGKGDKIENLSK